MKIKSKIELDKYGKKILPLEIIECNDGMGCVRWSRIIYCKNGRPHREDGPAIYRFGYEQDEWRLNGKFFHNKTKWKIALKEIRQNENALALKDLLK